MPIRVKRVWFGIWHTVPRAASKMLSSNAVSKVLGKSFLCLKIDWKLVSTIG